MDCHSYRVVKILKHGIKVVERLLEKRLNRLVKVDQMQFGFMPDRSKVDAYFILKRMQENTLRRIGSFLSVLLIWKRLSTECQRR